MGSAYAQLIFASSVAVCAALKSFLVTLRLHSQGECLQGNRGDNLTYISLLLDSKGGYMLTGP